MKPKQMPDFRSYEERDKFFKENAQYFTLIRKTGVGLCERTEYKTLDAAEKAAQAKAAITRGNYLIYAVIFEQSALVQAVPFKVSLKRVEGKTDLL